MLNQILRYTPGDQEQLFTVDFEHLRKLAEQLVARVLPARLNLGNVWNADTDRIRQPPLSQAQSHPLPFDAFPDSFSHNTRVYHVAQLHNAIWLIGTRAPMAVRPRVRHDLERARHNPTPRPSVGLLAAITSALARQSGQPSRRHQ